MSDLDMILFMKIICVSGAALEGCAWCKRTIDFFGILHQPLYTKAGFKIFRSEIARMLQYKQHYFT